MSKPERLKVAAQGESSGAGDHPSPFDAIDRGRAAELFRALGHEVRLHVLLSLSRSRGLTVSQLMDQIGIEQSALSHQLRALREARLVRPRRHGRHIHYELFDRHVSHLIEDALSHVREERSS